jgi:hypothetical protein
MSSFVLSNIAHNIPLASAQQHYSNFLTYTNTRLGFTFKYPSDWKIYEYEVESGGYITLLSSNSNASVGVSVGILKPNETGLTLEQYAKISLERDRLVASNVNPLEINTNSYALSGHPAARIIETLNYGTPQTQLEDTKQIRLFTLLDNKVYEISYGASPEKFPNNLQQAHAIIDSFQIISKQ